MRSRFLFILKWTTLAIAVVGGLFWFTVTAVRPPRYESSATLIVDDGRTRETVYSSGGAGVASLLVPLALLALLVLSLLLFRADRSPLNPRACRQCGYDLTGNTSGVCPECGRENTAAQ